MAERSLLTDILSAVQEPTEAAYRQACSNVFSSPRSLLDFVRDNPSLVYCLTHNGHRLVKLFGHIFSEHNKQQKSFPLQHLASLSSTLLTRIVSVLHKPDADVLASIIAPVLGICLENGSHKGRGLATTLVRHDGLVERLINNNFGARAISSWMRCSVITQQDGFTLSSWAVKLACSAKHCAADHHQSEEIDHWEDIKYLTTTLKRTERTTEVSYNHPLSIADRDRDLLKQFNVAIPESKRELSETIERLETEKTIAILQGLLTSFPCNLCRETLRRGAPIRLDKTVSAHLWRSGLSQFGMEVFGRNVGHWEVLLSTPALSNMLSLHSLETVAKIKEKLSMLAKGLEHETEVTGSLTLRQSLKVPLSVSRCTNDICIVWQIDSDVPYEAEILSQVIRVWDVVRTDEIDGLLEHVAGIQSAWTAETVDRCLQMQSPISKERLPAIYQPTTIGKDVVDFRKYVKTDVRSKDQYFYNLIGKFYPFTESFFRPPNNNEIALEFPYKLSPHEKDIVCHSGTSTIILGRSGTGKTTCLVFKLLGKHMASKGAGHDRPFRQALETLSPGSISGAELHEVATHGVANRTFINPPDALYPYICTFEEFLQVVENTVSVAHTPENQRIQNHGFQDKVDQRKAEETRGDCVDFPKFREDYWPVLGRDNERKLPISLVFAEIMGVIKGSNASALTLTPLTCEQYLQQSSRVAPAFVDEADRLALYKLYMKYENLKHERTEVDYVDRVLDVLKALEKTTVLKSILGTAVHEIYIDEVQDQRSVDLKLLLTLVSDGRCFHVAGDTAQAISQESNFRFEDLKAMVHDHFANGRDTRKKRLNRPCTFELGLNYRSHDGIVRLGSFIMGLLWKSFPETVDKLQPEEGLLPGPVPILFLGCEPDILAKINHEGSNSTIDKIKFGAEQVVLVRDEKSKAQLRDHIGSIALVLTIRESKGMEFDDVVLFDFFTSCPELDGWRSLSDAEVNESASFDSRRYVAICNELKSFYVAVTRARNKFFMIETISAKNLSPVVKLLTQCTNDSITQLIKRDDYGFFQNLQLLRPDRLTDPKRWIQRGSDLLSDGLYREALHCFEQADYQEGITLVTARIQQAEGSACLARNDGDGAAKAFEAAIASFLEIHRTDDAVRACRRMGWLKRAAELWKNQGEYRKAAELFNDAEQHADAAECYEKAQMYREAAEILWHGQKFDHLVRCLVKNREILLPAVLSTYVALCKIPLKQKKLSTANRKEIISLLESPKEREELFVRYEIYDELEELLVKERRFSDLFRLRCDLGNLDGALELVLRAKKHELRVDPEEVGRLVDYTMTGTLLNMARRRKRVPDKNLNNLKNLATHGQQERI
ncbi:MAG: hypothetical protein Q9169_003019 [Polycauliona sp. 2 TL-2023]